MSSFRDSAAILVSCTTEKSEVLSVDNLATDVDPTSRLLTFTKKNSGPSMEPWETPASKWHQF